MHTVHRFGCLSGGVGARHPRFSKAGRLLARQSFNLLKQCNSINDPTDGLFVEARAEWT
jgi:hypothetical protein